MKEKEFIAKLKSKDDKILLSYVLDKYYQFKRKKISTYSNFLNDRDLTFLENSLKFLKIPYNIYKPCNDCEKSIIYFGKYENFVTFYKIDIENARHQDVLGSLFGCGLTNLEIGDIFVLENSVYITNLEKYDFIIETMLNKIGRKSIKLEKIKGFPEMIRKFTELSLTVNSTRIDLIISKLLKLSRKDTIEYMIKKRILVNYQKNNKIINLKEGDILSIEGFGKVVINEIIINKNNLRVNIKKYC